MEEKLVNILNEMAEYLSVPQMKKLQEVLLDNLSNTSAQKENIENSEYLKLFLDAKRIEGCSERLQIKASIFPFQRRFQQEITELRVLRQHRPMAVGTENIPVMHALCSILSVVSITLQNRTERFHALSQICSAAVIFKTDNRASATGGIQPEGIIINHPGASAPGIKINRTQKLTPDTVIGLIVMSEHLVTSADTQKCFSVLNG